MKVSIPWLKELVEITDIKEVIRLLPLRTIAIKEVHDNFMELDMKGYNRADLLSMRGIALETAAITDSSIKFEELSPSDYIWTNNQLPQTPISIKEKELSLIQAVAKIEGLKIGPSSKEWVDKLKECGMRSVNNIADVTNLIMLEYGEPLHAFDQASVKNDTINVRRAKNNEEIVTLDDKLRKLTSDDIVLADEEKALDVAGVMGGKDTEVKESTNTILLSASLFNPTLVRKTATRLKLGSEASKRFYHGLTKKRLFQALNAAIKMYQQLGGKLVAFNIEGETEDEIKTLTLTHGKVNSLIGIDIPVEKVEEYLGKLGFNLEKRGSDWEVTVPYWRLDIEIEEDLVEEVARLYGYEKIPAKPLEGTTPEKIGQTLPNFIYNLKVQLKDLGLTEVQTYSFYSTAVLEALDPSTEAKKNLIKIANPISSETEYLRTDLWPNLLEVVAKNIKEGFKDIGIFEIGKIYKNVNGKPEEDYRISIALMNNTDNPIEELYQLTKSLCVNLPGFKLNPSTPPKEVVNLFHPKRFINIEKDGKMIAGIAEVHLRLLNKLGLENRVAVLEIEVEDLV